MEPPSKIHKLHDSCGCERADYDQSSESSFDLSDASQEIVLYDDDESEDISGLLGVEVGSDTDTDFEFSSQEEVNEKEIDAPEDPISCLPDKLFINIIQHLNGDDIKAAFCVSNHWSKLLLRSEEIIKKLFLKIDLTEEISYNDRLLSLFKSRRAYENVQISIGNIKEVEKKIDAILNKFACSIVSLKILKIGGFNSMMKQPLSFTKLQSLELHVVCGRLSCDLQNVCTLKKLSVNGLSPEALMLCLKNNPELEELVLYENAFISYLNGFAELELPFKLTKLSILDHITHTKHLEGEFPAQQWDSKARMKFLMSQASSLNSLHMEKCFVTELNRIVKFLPVLECLEVNQLIGDPSKLNIKGIAKIRTLIATKISDDLLCAAVNSFEHLKTIFIENLKTDQFFFIIRNAKSLKCFCYFFASATTKPKGNFIDLESIYHRADIYGSSCPDIEVKRMKKEFFIEMFDKTTIKI